MRLILFMLFAYVLEDSSVHSDIAGYYWRDYLGEIPDDAFPGGIDVNGDPIYIGQSIHSTCNCYDLPGKGPNDLCTCLVPGKIYGSTKKNSFESGGVEHEVTQNVKILCTMHPEQLEWIPTDHVKMKILNNVHLILGGYQHVGTIYIGRVRYKGESLIGKVIADNGPHDTGVWTTSIDKKPVFFKVFEVLSFNKNPQSLIDTRMCF